MSIITGFLAGITGWPQRIAFGGLLAALLAVGTWSIVQMFQLGDATKKIEKLDLSINAPDVGYVAKLAQSRSNAGNLQANIERQTSELRRVSTANAEAMAKLQARYDREHVIRVEAEKRAAVFMSKPPKGDTLDARVRDIDTRILEELK